MSFDSLASSSGSSTSHPLSVEIPSETDPSSVNSSLRSSPTNDKLVEKPPGPRGILESRSRTNSLPSSSTTSLNCPSPNITFAPLPELAPRRRKSAVPLGVAARSAMMRRRRDLRQGAQSSDPDNSGMWTDEEMQTHRRRAERRQEDLEDPLLALGKMVKDAWRKMNGKTTEKSKTPAVDTGATTPTVDAKTVGDANSSHLGDVEKVVGDTDTTMEKPPKIPSIVTDA